MHLSKSSVNALAYDLGVNVKIHVKASKMEHVYLDNRKSYSERMAINMRLKVNCHFLSGKSCVLQMTWIVCRRKELKAKLN